MTECDDCATCAHWGKIENSKYNYCYQDYTPSSKKYCKYHKEEAKL